MESHEHYMRRAIALTAHVPELPFGAVIVRQDDGAIMAEGWNRTTLNPTWHGEIDAINALYKSNRKVDGRRLVLYTTAEPCVMCMAALCWSGIATIVYGTSVRFLRAHGWQQFDLETEEVVRGSPGWEGTILGGVLRDECDALFRAGPPSE